MLALRCASLLLLLSLLCEETVQIFPDEEIADNVTKLFEDIERSQNSLKQIIKNVVLRHAPDDNQNKKEKECRCVPYFLCDLQTGEIIKDGRFLLESRLKNECPNIQEVCCEKHLINITNTVVPESKPESRCGLNSKIPTNLSSEASAAYFGEHPWTAVLFRHKTIGNGKWEYSCVGSLIHPQVILTAAHCVNSTDEYTIRVGEWDFQHKKETLPYQTGAVKTVAIHPGFRRDILVYDAALLIADKEFKLGDNVNTICLSKSAPEPLITRSKECVASGWGITKPGGRYNRIMQRIGCSLTLHEDCQNAFRKTHLGEWFELHQTFVCANPESEVDVCEGFGGAPLACPIADEARYQLTGVTSWGIGCATGLPTVFAKVSQLREWVDEEFDKRGFSKQYYTYAN